VLSELRDLPSRAIAAELTNRAIPTPRGGDWQSTTVMRLLRRLELRWSSQLIGASNREREQFSTGEHPLRTQFAKISTAQGRSKSIILMANRRRSERLVLRPTQVPIFGNRRAGILLMQDDQKIRIDLRLRALI
jgi:Recombinase